MYGLIKILVLDDDINNWNVIKNCLEKNNYQLTFCKSLREAEYELDASKHHVAIINILLSETDGIECLKRIRKTDALMQVIMIIAEREIDREVHKISLSLENGARDYVLKPIDEELLLAAVNDCAERLRSWWHNLRQIAK